MNWQKVIDLIVKYAEDNPALVQAMLTAIVKYLTDHPEALQQVIAAVLTTVQRPAR